MVERKNFLLTKFKFLTERQKGREKPFSPQFNEENLKSDLEEATKKLQAKVLVQGEPVEIITIVSGEKYQRDDRGLSLKC
ncbi:MAG TPA: hypothetical protein PK131_03430, partial [Candidatus Woesebacteria bacterium]|nr:hypothetical protein [Candidatus Woesebacteria bacterium]